MTHRKLAAAWLLVLMSFIAPSYAADPEFKAALVTESRQYEREKVAPSFGGIRLPGPTEWTSRVTVALDGERITGRMGAENHDQRLGRGLSARQRRAGGRRRAISSC